MYCLINPTEISDKEKKMYYDMYNFDDIKIKDSSFYEIFYNNLKDIINKNGYITQEELYKLVKELNKLL